MCLIQLCPVCSRRRLLLFDAATAALVVVLYTTVPKLSRNRYRCAFRGKKS